MVLAVCGGGLEEQKTFGPLHSIKNQVPVENGMPCIPSPSAHSVFL